MGLIDYMKKGTFKKLTFEEAKLKLKNRILKPKTSPKSSLKRGSMVKPIPAKMRAELSEDPFMQECCVRSFSCRGRIQFHHNLIYAGKRINEYGAILPLCEYHHQKESKFKKQLNEIMSSRMTDADRAKYPKKKWL